MRTLRRVAALEPADDPVAERRARDPVAVATEETGARGEPEPGGSGVETQTIVVVDVEEKRKRVRLARAERLGGVFVFRVVVFFARGAVDVVRQEAADGVEVAQDELALERLRRPFVRVGAGYLTRRAGRRGAEGGGALGGTEPGAGPRRPRRSYPRGRAR